MSAETFRVGVRRCRPEKKPATDVVGCADWSTGSDTAPEGLGACHCAWQRRMSLSRAASSFRLTAVSA